MIGHRVADAERTLGEFKVERIETASAAPAGEVLAQEPAPAASVRRGSTVILRVSDASLAGAAGTNPVTEPVAAAASAPAPDTSLAPTSAPVASPPQEPVNPVTAAAASAAATFAPVPAVSLAPASTPVAAPPHETIDPPGVRGQLPAAFSAGAALIFVAGASLGLLSGALLMRQSLLRGRRKLADSAPPPTLRQLRHRLDQHRVDQQPAESDARGHPETGASPEIRFAAWLVPSATTIVLAPRRITDGIRTSIRATTAREQVWLLAPIEVGGNAVGRALAEQGKNESAVARVVDRLTRAAAERAADELNRALDVDIFDVLAQGWVQVPALHGAVLLSAVKRGPPVLVRFDVPHSITSTSYLVLDTRVAGSSLPPLELALEIVADLQGATVAVSDGRIDLVALGEATVRARLTYKAVLVTEHATKISGTPCDPSEPLPDAAERPASIDIPI